MEFTARRSAQLAAVALISLVVTQIVYISLSESGLDIDRPVIWTVEAIAYLAVTVFALVPALRGAAQPASWVAIAAGGLLNVIQVGMGIAMFPPLMEAGEALAPAFAAVLAGAFFLYFAGKVLFGFAALALGLAQARSGQGAARWVGGLAALAGLAAMVLNVAAILVGREATFAAGASGTLATLLLALQLTRALETREA